MVAHAFNASIWEAETDLCVFKVSLVYIANSRPAMSNSRHFCLRKKKIPTKQKMKHKNANFTIL